MHSYFTCALNKNKKAMQLYKITMLALEFKMHFYGSLLVSQNKENLQEKVARFKLKMQDLELKYSSKTIQN